MPLHDDGDGESDNPLAVADRPLGQPRRPTPHAEREVGQRDAPLPRLVVVEHRVDRRRVQLRIWQIRQVSPELRIIASFGHGNSARPTNLECAGVSAPEVGGGENEAAVLGDDAEGGGEPVFGRQAVRPQA